ncbi:hypothetical protein, conserved in T. vivax [Trypanosoma vivax Y486]|uniref:Uncharacterized protein n=1 Tax=Trypanosoma vivax (strain Y486) TaxID=1055687 RepID=F9WKF0_TRYVY|nr:hypothetical protein, conserved in T. vivax [Trypanosoma vivax Y486]|eukprot:CCD17970.1 hypothetical protein, conserved in T. vivax [Trypanosoma vivax Y486]
MKKNSPLLNALPLLTILWFAAVCRASVSHGDPEPWKTEQKKRENALLCGAADLYVEWNVTFGALQKRAEKVNATATKILRNLELYKSSTGVKHNTSVAIETLKNVVGNTSVALHTSREFMNGIERDFFNAFEAVKDNPNMFTFGYSNWNVHGKRESEILGFFKNITKLFTECKTNRTGRNVTIDLLKQKVMNEVDNETTNLTKWEAEQRDKWNATLTNVTTWLKHMQNYTYNHSTDGPKRTVNIWTYNVTAWDTIKKDCHRVAYNCSNNSTVPNIVNLSRLNILRHLQDITNQSTANNSLKENGCEGGHELFQSTVSAGFSEVEKNESKLEEMCKKLNETLQNPTCTANRTSIEWMRHRFNVAVPKIAESLSKSLVQLMDAEKLVMGTFADLFTSRREALCNETRIVSEMSASFEAANTSVNVLLDSSGRNITEARSKSRAALELLSEAQTFINTASTNSSEMKSADVVIKVGESVPNDLKSAGQELINKAESSREDLKKVQQELKAALENKRIQLETVRKNFSDALTRAENGLVHNDNACNASNFVSPSVTVYVADDVFTQLLAVKFSVDSPHDVGLPEHCDGELKPLHKLVKSICGRFNAARNNTFQALQQAIVAEEKAKEAYRMARDIFKKELEKQKTNLCDTVKQLTEISGTMEMLQKDVGITRESAGAHWRRAVVASQVAEEAATRAVAAEPHASEAATHYQMTSEAVWAVRIDANRLGKNATFSLRNNRERIRRINSIFTAAIKAISNQQCKTEDDVCKSALDCNVTLGLESLHRIQNLTVLMNVTDEKEKLKRLVLAEKNVKELMRDVSRRASAAEAAAAAALKAAEGSECTPLYLQLLHVVDNFS